ncbi:MAG: cbb3-type cytochrome oxidase assembly protein CcoS [Verrucomicrobia bacterium]|jgi:cbb3-type cytochrome oxidase maturation protein|nr:cbb3-type cytochrome oxidase assembly protein CcoS [Verrucomicrobiota bacterium]MBT7068827.1 cbb3-type cytochrome oxidase assembly protein CcoS [Verrucomicrobiota bacterium]MBT7699883.1 cbb3-type cytochrome oxidase assembly protein CcoS [Verrucomicrobiota bacterium]
MLHMILLFGSLALGGLFVWLYIWAVRGGQFKDPEEAKYLMFREDDNDEHIHQPAPEDGKNAKIDKAGRVSVSE